MANHYEVLSCIWLVGIPSERSQDKSVPTVVGVDGVFRQELWKEGRAARCEVLPEGG